MKILVAVFLSFVCVCAAADNQRGFYIGAGLAENIYDDDVIDVDNSRAIEIFGGYKYNAALGVEIRMGKGSTNGKSDSYINDLGVELPGRVEREIDSYYSIYYKPELINDEAKLYLLLGYMDIDSIETIVAADASPVAEFNTSESGASYGIGIGFVINAHFNFNIEYRTLPKQNDVESNIASANFDYRF